MKNIAGINGCGRFGLHLLRYWLENINGSLFDVFYLNDEFLTIDEVVKAIEFDDFLDIKIAKIGSNAVEVYDSNNNPHKLWFSNVNLNDISWLEKIDFLFECSGKYKENAMLKKITETKVKKIIISASSSIADQMLIYGFNHNTYNPESEIISYGSCTINAYVPIASLLNNKFGVVDSDCAIIHNTPKYRLHEFIQPKKQHCTLEAFGPKLLDFLSIENFKVSYTTIAYLGVSLISYRFNLLKTPLLGEVMSCLQDSLQNDLEGLYSFTNSSTKPNDHKFTNSSAVVIEDTIRLVGNNLYIDAFFDNENSVNRLFDLSNFICGKGL